MNAATPDAHAAPVGAPTDEELMERFRRSAEDSAARLIVQRCSSSALTIALSYLHDRELALEAVQESLLRLVSSRHRYRSGSPFLPWFYAIVRNVCRDSIRRAKAYAKLRDHLAREIAEPAAPQPQSATIALLERLSEDDRRVLTLCVCDGFTMEQVGAAIGCSTEAAKKRAQRAIKRLRELADFA